MRNLKYDERGFVFLEVLVGLPLIIILFLSLNNIFVNTWTNCKYMLADFILQQEMESAMSRIVADAQIAYKVIAPDEYDKSQTITKLIFSQHEMHSFDKLQKRFDLKSQPYYEHKDGKLYYNGKGSSITGEYNEGEDISKRVFISDPRVTKFQFYTVHNNPKLLYIRIEAKSNVSGHNIVLITKVFMRGLQDE